MSTFNLKTDAKSEPFDEKKYIDFTSYLYGCMPVQEKEGKILVHTKPTNGHVIAPEFQNGFIGAIFQSYNEHRHLVLTPDDVWLAITTALSLYVNNHAEEMRSTFVNHEGKIELTVDSIGNLYSANWEMLIEKMSGLIEKNTNGDVRSWIEPNFSTTTTTIRTVGQVVLMGVMKEYFDFRCNFMCGLPKVTLEGTLGDWKELRRKASHLKTLKVDCLTHWAELLDIILAQFEQSYMGNVDAAFWSNICKRQSWGSGDEKRLSGWLNVFTPFDGSGNYRLNCAQPAENNWCTVRCDNIHPSTTEVPVLINDNGKLYSTIFYGGHIACVYNKTDDTVRPSLDWAIVDVTEFLDGKSKDEDEFDKVPDELQRLHKRKRGRLDQNEYQWKKFPKPTNFGA